MPTIYLRPTDEQKSRLRQLAANAGVSENAYMLLLLDQADNGPTLSTGVAADPEATAMERITVRLPAFLKRAVAGRARAAGMSMGRWVSCLVQSNLMRVPVLTDAELAAVIASRRELAAVGRNINQIARALNDAPHEIERIRLEKLSELAAVVGKTRASISALVRSSNGVWGVESE